MRFNKALNEIKQAEAKASSELIELRKQARELYEPIGAQSEEYKKLAATLNELCEKEGLNALKMATGK